MSTTTTTSTTPSVGDAQPVKADISYAFQRAGATSPANKQLLTAALETITGLAKQLSAVKDMVPISDPIQNIAAYDVEEICAQLEEALK